MRVAKEIDWSIIQNHIDQHTAKFPPGVPRRMPSYWDGVWILSTNEACSMFWKESESDIQMILIWNSTIKSSAGAKELVEFAKRYSSKPIVFSTYAGTSAGTQRAFEKWGFVPLNSDETWVRYQYAQ
jgi:hypothetical protein